MPGLEEKTGMEMIPLGWKRRLEDWNGSDTPGLEEKTGMEVIPLGWKRRLGWK